MATLRQQYDLSQDKKFSQRVIQGAVTVAFEVIQEDPKTEGHAPRRALAMSVLGNPVAHEVRMAAAVVTDPATYDAQSGKDNEAADTALLSRLREVWSDLAGVMS